MKLRATKKYMPPRRGEILAFVAHYLGRYGYAPTQHEIANGLKLKRPLVSYHLAQLAVDKYIRITGEYRRNIEVLHF